MATNKHAIIRYRVIDQCLRKLDGTWNWKSLAEACSNEIQKSIGTKTTLSERTIKGDIQAMRLDERLGYFAPIEYDRKEKSYYYSDRTYSITESPLNKTDSQELKQVIGLLRQFTGFKHLEGIDNIIHKLELMVYESVTKSKQIVHLEQAVSIPGQKWLDEIYQAIKEETALVIEYQAFDKPVSNAVISPHLLKDFKNRWYLIAMNHAKKGMRTYGLERIKSIKKSLHPFVRAKDFDPDSYYEDIIGITLEPGKKKSQIIFEAYGYLIPFLKTQGIHSSQIELEASQDKSRFSINLVPNNELENLFLSFGENIQILKPTSLRKKLESRLKASIKRYD